ncbi:pyruvate formate lyase-activating protein [Opitutaceae bacterium TAV5]|nr:pyruvate formate lyase-activating protein [Opitutaceae bacterium TAV5]
MRIGGYVPCSLSDFPGRIAAVVFTQGCNWRCPWCHNTALVYPEQFTPPIPEADIFARLATRRGKLDGVVISGGEPTLHPDLPDFIRRIRALGFQVKLDTNGSRPGVIRSLIAEGLLDFVATDIKAPWPRYAEAAGLPAPAFDTDALRETLALLRETGIEHQLRTTRWPGLGEADEPLIEAIAAGSPHVWQEYREPT